MPDHRLPRRAGLDQVFLRCAATGGVTQPGDSGSFTVYTSGQNGTTPSAGKHTIILATETMWTQSGQFSGAHVGDLASVGTSPYPFGGALRSAYTAALVAEKCYLRVAGISRELMTTPGSLAQYYASGGPFGVRETESVQVSLHRRAERVSCWVIGCRSNRSRSAG